jgi:hypothetical protein
VNESSNMDDFIIDVYIGVNSNILWY